MGWNWNNQQIFLNEQIGGKSTISDVRIMIQKPLENVVLNKLLTEEIRLTTL